MSNFSTIPCLKSSAPRPSSSLRRSLGRSSPTPPSGLAAERGCAQPRRVGLSETHDNTTQMGSDSAKKSYYIFIICSWSHPPRQLFHTFSSLPKHYLPFYPHFQPMTTISPSLRKVTITRHLPQLPLSTAPPQFCTLSLVTGQLSVLPPVTSHFYSASHSCAWSRASPSNAPLCLLNYSYSLHT